MVCDMHPRQEEVDHGAKNTYGIKDIVSQSIKLFNFFIDYIDVCDLEGSAVAL